MTQFHMNWLDAENNPLAIEYMSDIDALCNRLVSALDERWASVADTRPLDEDRTRHVDVLDQIREMRMNGYPGDSIMTFPGGDRLHVFLGDGDVDAIVAKAYEDIQWVIDDLRSWESNPESCKYDANKLADALAVIKVRRGGHA